MKLFSRRSWCVALLAGGLSVAGLGAASAPELRTFDARSLAAIKQAHAGRPFLVAFWSVSCEPCREEMMIVADLHRRFPNVPIVLVAADAPPHREAVRRFLSGYTLGRIETWQFGEESMERLRYAVDKSWAGELPRSYFFNAAHEATAHSGVVDAKWLGDWLAQAEKTARK
ncbi:MAG: redoxin domain-containing protein [Opitutaceae bacterium]|nr:redoxin domain-containing protein [Opitutaceae bacterium]